MQERSSYNKDSGAFTKKLQNIDHILWDAIIVTGNVLSLHPSIPRDAGLKRKNFFETNSFVEFNGEAKNILCASARL